jgi:hypothetical protein
MDNVQNVINKKTDWVVISKNKKDGKRVAKVLKNFVLNPGCLYEYKEELIFNVLARSIRDNIKNQDLDFQNIASYYPEDKIIKIDNMLTQNSLSQKISCKMKKIVKILKIRKYFW